jgi:hypothetical protein
MPGHLQAKALDLAVFKNLSFGGNPSFVSRRLLGTANSGIPQIRQDVDGIFLAGQVFLDDEVPNLRGVES